LDFLKYTKLNGKIVGRRRGISQIFGSLMLLAIVVPLGTVILFNGTMEINAFNNELASTLQYKNNAIREDLIFEHVRFDPVSSDVMISIRNAGTVVTTIDRISILNMTNQKLLYNMTGISSFIPVVIPLKNSTDIPLTGAIPEGGRWDTGNQVGDEYRISIITSRGNFFDTVARAFNT
jgi:flagellin-like protein